MIDAVIAAVKAVEFDDVISASQKIGRRVATARKRIDVAELSGRVSAFGVNRLAFGFGSRAKEVSRYIELFVKMFDAARAMDAVLDGKREVERYTNYQWLLNYAAIYGAADSYAQLKRINSADTARGIELYFAKYANGAETYRKVVVAGTMPEMAQMVHAAGEAVCAVLARKADVSATFSRLYKTFLELSRSKL